jgi:uncharacterized protein YcbX
MKLIVKELWIYPVKSMGGISMSEAKALRAGFEYDRRWMLLDHENKFITQRQVPELALFKTSISDGQLTLTYNNHSYHIRVDEHTSENINTNVWEDDASTMRVSPLVDEWLGDALKMKVRLVKICNEQSRIHHNKNHDIHLPVSLADGYPYLVAGTASLDLLNNKLDAPIQMSRFRPNIVVVTTEAHEEDIWKECKTGTAEFLNMKPCGRCTMITIDQNTAQINNEPLKILNQYRKSLNSVLFGTNMMCTKEGLVTVGDEMMIHGTSRG